jgi:hypothetical protein
MAKMLKVALSHDPSVGLLQAEAVSAGQQDRLNRKYGSYTAIAWSDTPLFAETAEKLSKKAVELLFDRSGSRYRSLEAMLPVRFFEDWVENSTATRSNTRKKHHPKTPLRRGHDLIKEMVKKVGVSRLKPSEYKLTLQWSGSAENYEKEYEHHGAGDEYFNVKIYDFEPLSARLRAQFGGGPIAFGNDYEGWHIIEDH